MTQQDFDKWKIENCMGKMQKELCDQLYRLLSDPDYSQELKELHSIVENLKAENEELKEQFAKEAGNGKILFRQYQEDIEQRDKEIERLKNKIGLKTLGVWDSDRQEIERLKGLIKNLFKMYNREVMFPDRLETFWQQFKKENNL